MHFSTLTLLVVALTAAFNAYAATSILNVFGSPLRSFDGKHLIPQVVVRRRIAEYRHEKGVKYDPPAFRICFVHGSRRFLADRPKGTILKRPQH